MIEAGEVNLVSYYEIAALPLVARNDRRKGNGKAHIDIPT
jgi:hypothetical protein